MWFFPNNSGGEERGLNDSGINTFTRSDRLGRETCQNVQDAHSPRAKDKGLPAKVEFELLELHADQFPGIERFRQIFKACSDYHLDGCTTPEEKTSCGKEFFEIGLNLLQSSSIKVLRITDSNTTGLAGNDEDRDSQWFRLIRGQGRPRFEGLGGGTYGIGQRAPFAFSQLRTVFYSTCLPDNTKRFMGKSIICTFHDPQEDVKKQNIGFWGKQEGDNILSITNPTDIPEFFQIDQPGTAIYIAGFDRSEWEYQTLRSMLVNFFASIYSRQLEVKIKGEKCYHLNSDTLSDYIQMKDLRDDSSAKSDLIDTQYFLDAIQTDPHIKDVKNLGKCKLFITRHDDAPQRIAYMRTPRILVRKQTSKKLSGYQGVFICDNEDGNPLLASMENPDHNEWNPEHAAFRSSENKRKGKTALKNMRKFIRETLEELADQERKEVEDFPDLSEFLPAEEEDEEQEIMGGTDPTDKSQEDESPLPVGMELPLKEINVVTYPEPPRVPDYAETGKHNGGGKHEQSDNSDPNPTPNPDDGDSLGFGSDDLPGIKYGTLNYRSYAQKKKDGYMYRLILHPLEECCGDLSLVAVGEDSNYNIDIASVINPQTGVAVPFSKNTIQGLHLYQGKQLDLDLRIKTSVRLTLAMGRI
ncbi:MAG: hypothetical protein HN379_07085 [Desulfobacteraceae bacterium]|jgi:hypothetical protein|nr:hypothetical protein [Desulfobacteraceae bacterium]